MGMRNPNGFGCVVYLGDGRRRPWAARRSHMEDGRQVCSYIGAFATKQEALVALAKYHDNPVDLSLKNITTAELYTLWAEAEERLSGAYMDGFASIFKNHLRPLHNVPYSKIRYIDMEKSIKDCKVESVRFKIKVLFGHLDRYAHARDIISKGYSGDIVVAHYEPRKAKTPFTCEEVALFWANIGAPWVDTVLIYLYSGWRARELLSLEKADIDIDAGTMRGGMKSTAGKKRIVPIHSRILPLIKARMASEGAHLITEDGEPVDYSNYRNRFDGVMDMLGMVHTIHETRHTFRTALDAASAPIACANKLMGHKCGDIGLSVYTHNTIEELRKTIELVQY